MTAFYCAGCNSEVSDIHNHSECGIIAPDIRMDEARSQRMFDRLFWDWSEDYPLGPNGPKGN